MGGASPLAIDDLMEIVGILDVGRLQLGLLFLRGGLGSLAVGLQLRSAEPCAARA